MILYHDLISQNSKLCCIFTLKFSAWVETGVYSGLSMNQCQINGRWGLNSTEFHVKKTFQMPRIPNFHALSLGVPEMLH